MSVSKRVRFEVFKRDKFTCQYCGRSAPDIVLHCDHITPKASGGTDDILNLVTSCADCNLGKGARELSDNTAIVKRRKQLEELQERRDQLEMLLEWHRELASLNDDIVQKLAAFWGDLADCTVTSTGLDHIKSWLRNFSESEILECMRISARQYIDPVEATTEQKAKAFDYVPKIANVRRREEKQPWLKDINYIRGILRNRLHYVNEGMAAAMLTQCIDNGYTINELKTIALEVKNWTEFRSTLEDMLSESTA